MSVFCSQQSEKAQLCIAERKLSKKRLRKFVYRRKWQVYIYVCVSVFVYLFVFHNEGKRQKC